jgi:3',5'-cyclic AMP phosphodiesterase CpdA
MRSLPRISKNTPKSSYPRNRSFLVLILLPFLFSCAKNGEVLYSSYPPYQLSFAGTYPQTTLQESPLTFMVATDLHYLSPTLFDNGSAFTSTIANADGKVSNYGPEVLDAFLETVKAKKPSALFLTGDLTFNGERASHEELAKKLQAVVDGGIPVLLIPGNHDIGSVYSYRYHEAEVSRVETTYTNDFLTLYAPVVYQKVSSFDPTSLSFVYPLRKDLRVMGISSDGTSDMVVPESTLAWMKEEIEKANQDKVKLITLTHESLIKQNALFSSYSLQNAAEVYALLAKGKTLANFSGHLHIEHRSSEGDIVDFCTSSLLVAPCHYAVVDLSTSALNYHTENVDVASYAKAHNLTDENLLSFPSYAENFFRTSNRHRMALRLEESNYTAEEKKALLDSYEELNYRYFAGEKTEESLFQEGFDLWANSTLPSARYVASMRESDQMDFTSYKKAFDPVL